MSTFVFAPSWVTYPNQPKPVKNRDEFPTLSSNTTPTPTNNNTSVWTTSHLIKKLQDNDDLQEEDDEILEERRYELERLKALVPKTSNNNKKFSKHNASINTRKTRTKKPISTSSSTSSSRSNTKPSRMIPKLSSPETAAKTITTITNISPAPVTTVATTTTTSVSTSSTSSSTKVDEVSLKEQEHFIHFIKYWTSNSTNDDAFPEYTYFKPNTTSNNYKPTDLKAFTDNSYFYYDPFNKNP